MITLLLIYAAFLTLFIIGNIHHYEEKMRDLRGAISDYKRALKVSKNGDHYTYLQLQNAELKNKIKDIYHVNEVLQYQNERLKKDNQELINGVLPQYESSSYKGDTWESAIKYYQEDIDFEQ